MAVPAAALGRTGMPGKAEGIPKKGLAVIWKPGSAAMVQRMMEVDDEEEVLELDKKPE